ESFSKDRHSLTDILFSLEFSTSSCGLDLCSSFFWTRVFTVNHECRASMKPSAINKSLQQWLTLTAMKLL
ncbi:hypothetical protein scyTo_0021378, partial [Scyliorhinus torazame]|nr:hypothetical protein [Scyliorhinus torazame]